jgi:uncharacterized protein (TIGR00299 family) protein
MHLHLDCTAGVAGDMLLAALLDLDGDESFVSSLPLRLGLVGVEVDCQRTKRHQITARQVIVRVTGSPPQRHLSHIEALLSQADLSEHSRAKALSVFRRLAEAEARIHDTTTDKVHFHEVGADDALVDIAGTCALLEKLGVERLTASSLPANHGTVQAAHGAVPLPAPAVLELVGAWPLDWFDGVGERVTPTGAALVTTLAVHGLPARGTVQKVGYGAGGADFPDRANLVRALAIRPLTTGAAQETITELVTSLDDMTGEELAFAAEIFLGEGALDVYYAPLVMKKGRPGWELRVLCRPGDASGLANAVLMHTSSGGVRSRDESRYVLERKRITVQTSFGDIDMKVFELPNGGVKAAPEYESCKSAATSHGVPLRVVHQAALAAYAQSGEGS